MLIRILTMSLLLIIGAAAHSIIPAPNQLEYKDGELAVNAHLNIVSNDAILSNHAADFRKWLKNTYQITPSDTSSSVTVKLRVDNSLSLGPEGYQLSINSERITITGKAKAGVFYGLQSFKQLFPAPDAAKAPFSHTFRNLEITDEPRFRWRGMHLDVSRHFFPKEDIKRYIDLLAAYKFNTFHWHLVDGPGWRIEIKKYPRLTSVGAWRKDKRASEWNWQQTEIHRDGKQPDDYGGFYTQDDIREIVAYAQERHITIVPEIEMPGHSYAALVAYPEFSCPTNKIHTEGLKGKDVFCVGNEASYTFLQDILDEVLTLFPSPYIHIGADEVPKSAWKECPKCQHLKTSKSLLDEEHLQSHFVRRMERYLKSKNRTLVGWDEINEGGLPEHAAVMVWRDEKFARTALEHGHPVIMCPNSHCYFDYYQSKSESHPLAIGGYVPTQKVYAFEPVLPGLTKAQQELVLGVQGNVWTEYIQTREHLEYMILPRMCALAEVAWTHQTNKSWSQFPTRIQLHKSIWKHGQHSFCDEPINHSQNSPTE